MKYVRHTSSQSQTGTNKTCIQAQPVFIYSTEVEPQPNWGDDMTTFLFNL